MNVSVAQRQKEIDARNVLERNQGHLNASSGGETTNSVELESITLVMDTDCPSVEPVENEDNSVLLR